MNALVWFKNDLRVEDNHSLSSACAKGNTVVALYCFDPRQFAQDRFGFKKTERFRARFLMETVGNLSDNLAKLNVPLFVYLAKPEEILPDLVAKHDIDEVFLQKEWTPEEVEVLSAVKSACDDQLPFTETFDQFLYHPHDVVSDGYSKIPKVFTSFRKKIEKQVFVQEPVSAPEALSEKNPLDNKTKIPTLKDLGFAEFERDERSAFPFVGGENTAGERLRHYFWDSKKLATYKKTRNGLIGRDYSSKFSAWLANGSISPRRIYAEVKRFEAQEHANDSTYWLIFELIWRDFFKYISLKNGDKIFKIGGILDKEYDWKNNNAARNAWIEGKTKYDFVNANMREIALTGFMSNRGRQNVASFWAKELRQDWRVGAAYFESMLIDYDVHSNYGNWIYNSGVGNDPRDRKFNIKTQAERYDADGNYVRLWLQDGLF